MLKLLWKILMGENGGTLSITRKTANTLITAAGFNTNYDEIEAVVNGDIDGTNIEDDSITAAKLASDIVRSGYGLLQHTDGTLYVDVYGVLVNAGTNGIEWGRANDMLLSASAVTPDGFTDVSATYEGKFIRVSASALSTGGSNTHSHTLAEANLPSHTHTGPSHTHTVGDHTHYTCNVGATAGNTLGYSPTNAAIHGDTSNWNFNGTVGRSSGMIESPSTGAGGTGATGSTGSGTAFTGDNVPVYLGLKMYKKS